MAMLTMLFDGGIAGDLREQLLISLQDQIDNVVGPKMARNMAVENGRTEGMGDRGALRNVSRLVDRAGRMGRVEPEEQMAASREKNRGGDENWIRDLKPEEVELIGDILKQYLA